MNEDVNYHLLYFIIVLLMITVALTVNINLTINKMHNLELEFDKKLDIINMTMIECSKDLADCEIKMDSLEDSYIGRYEDEII